MAVLPLGIDTATGSQVTISGGGDSSTVASQVIDLAMSASQKGTTFKDVGVVYLVEGTILSSDSTMWMGVDNAVDDAEVEIRNATTGALLATITKTGIIGEAQPGSDVVVTAAGHYALRLRADAADATAFLLGVHLVYEALTPPGLIAEWNRSDLTQLVSAGAVDFSTTGGSPTLAVAAVAERGNVLRYTPGGAAGSGTHIFMFSTASGLLIPSADERRDINIEMELYDATFGGNSAIGAFVYGDADTPLHGFCHCPIGPTTGTNEREAVLNNGTIQTAGANGTAFDRVAKFLIRGRKPSGAAPEVSSYARGWNTASGSNGEPRRSGTTATARGSVQAFGNGSALGATWNAISADRIGIALRFGAPPTQVDILNFRIFWAS